MSDLCERRILVTGSRNWTDREVVRRALWEESGGMPATLVHGACPYGGADIIAAVLAAGWGWRVEPHHAQWGRYGKAAGPMRNREMVDLGASVCLAFPLGASRGTRGCMELARAAGITVRNFGDLDE